MKKYILLIFILLLFLSNNAFAASMEEIYLDIKIGNTLGSLDGISIYSKSGLYLYDRNSRSEIYNLDSESITLSLNYNGYISIFDINKSYITEIPSDGSILIGSNNMKDSTIQVDKNKYRDFITFLRNGNEILFINYIELDNYLYGVIPREIPASAPMEALKAQVIASRSYTIANINKHKKDNYNLCDKVDCQVYGAFDNEKPTTNQAVDETKGIYASYDGKAINATFHSTSGGYTEDSGKVWGGSVPYLVAVKDDFSINSPNSSWTVEITAREIKEKLSLQGIDIGDIVELVPMEITESNRVQKLKIKGSNGEHILSSSNFRNLMGTTYLKSTWFSIDTLGSGKNSKVFALSANNLYPTEVVLGNVHIIDGRNLVTATRTTVSRAIDKNRTSTIGEMITDKPNTFVFNGRGYGHGVGMSQYGAMEMAKQGYTFEEIIKYYYQGVDLVFN